MALLDTEGVIEMYADFAEDYDDTVLNDYKYTAYAMIPAVLVAKLQKSARTGSDTLRVLDLGCGTGLSSTEFFKCNEKVVSTSTSGQSAPSFAVWGMDLSPEMLARAKLLPFEKLFRGNKATTPTHLAPFRLHVHHWRSI